MMVNRQKRLPMSDITATCGLDSRANDSNTMTAIGTFTYTTGEPLRLQGFSDGAAVSWARDKGIQEQIKEKIEDQFDVFSDDTYPYEDYYKYVEAGFLQGIKDAESVNEAAVNWAGLEAVAALSALDRQDHDQDEEQIKASYIEILKKHSLAAALLSQAGIAVAIETQPELAVRSDQANEGEESQDT